LPVAIAFPANVMNRKDGAAVQTKQFHHIVWEEILKSGDGSAGTKIVWEEGTRILAEFSVSVPFLRR